MRRKTKSKGKAAVHMMPDGTMMEGKTHAEHMREYAGKRKPRKRSKGK